MDALGLCRPRGKRFQTNAYRAAVKILRSLVLLVMSYLHRCRASWIGFRSPSYTAARLIIAREVIRSVAVPKLTRSVDIKLNARVSLRLHARALSIPTPDIAHTSGRTPRQSRQAIIFRLAALF